MAFTSQGFASTLKPLSFSNPSNYTKDKDKDDDDNKTEDDVVEDEDVEDITEEDPENPEVQEDHTTAYFKRYADTNPDLTFTTLENFDFQNSEELSLILDTQVKFESNYDEQAAGTSGEIGIAQFMPRTWQMAKDMGWVDQDADRSDVAASLKAQKEFMSYLYNKSFVASAGNSRERWMRALAAYNWGEGNLSLAIQEAEKDTGDPNNWIDKAPPVTKRYIFQILSTASDRKRAGFKSQYTWKKWGGILYYYKNTRQ